MDNDFSASPTPAKLKTTLWTFKPWNGPGPNGLHPGFFQRYWDTVANSVLQCTTQAFESGSIPPALNQTLLCFITKHTKPELVTQFRPIGLCNTIYKLITCSP
ncbi:hypothetical protein CsSME_00007836 [Camellia sinensis var. sinensis]